VDIPQSSNADSETSQPAIAPEFYHNIFGWDQTDYEYYIENPEERMKYDIPERPTSLSQIDGTPRGSYWVKENMYVASM